MAHAAHADVSFASLEKNLGQDIKGNNLAAVAKELNQLRTLDNNDPTKINADLGKINDYLHSQLNFPNVDVLDYKNNNFTADGTDFASLKQFLDQLANQSNGAQPTVGDQAPSSEVGSQWSGGGDSSGGDTGGGGGGGAGGGVGGDSGAGGGSSGGGAPGDGNVSGGSIPVSGSDNLPDLSSPDLNKFYEYPLVGSATQNPERIDQGVDFGGGGQYKAIGNSVVDAIIPNWYQGQPLVELTLTDGPLKGRQYYVAEGINPTVKVGEHVQKGQVIANLTNGPTGIETGWGAGGGKTLAQATTGYTEGQATPAGQSFSQFLQKLGGPGGRS